MTETSTRIRVWDLPVRIFHWALVGAFAGAYLLAESERQRQIHVMLGYTVLGLVAFRLLWGFVGTRYARFGAFLYGPRRALGYLRGMTQGNAPRYIGHNPLGSWAVYAILAVAAATGITGYMTFNEIGGDAVEEVHELLANGWLLLVGVHVAGVILSSFMHRENLVKSMVTGYKQAAAGEPSARLRPLVGALVAAGVVGFWTYSLVTGGVPGTGPADPGLYAQSTLEQGEAGDDD
jgi:cytochrome b